MIKISKGNSKIGNIPNFSKTPVKTCQNCSACAKNCYALKAYRLYKTAREAWDNNSNEIEQVHEKGDWSEIISDIVKSCRTSLFFRFMVSGDVQYQDELNAYFIAAEQSKRTKFLLFTKNFELDFSKAPRNFKVIFSVFPGMEKQEIPAGSIAYAGDVLKIRPGRIFECSGLCENCGHMCWNLRKNEHVHFIMH